MPSTTNFGWTTPADTDLVKDGASAIRTLGNGIDTSFVDLKGGTTGQVLSKNSNTDLDFAWVSDATGIPATIFDAKGDIIAATAADTASRLAVGTNGQVLTADSSTATGLKWATAASSSPNWSLLNSGGTTLSGASTTVSGISGVNQILIILENASQAGLSWLGLRLNGDTATNYDNFGINYVQTNSTATAIEGDASTGGNRWQLAYASAANGGVYGAILIDGCNSSGKKIASFTTGVTWLTSGTAISKSHFGIYNSTSTISSIEIGSQSSTLDAGKVYVYTSVV